MSDFEQGILTTVAAGTGAVTLIFAIVAVLRHNDAANRLWAIGLTVLAITSIGLALAAPEQMHGGQAALLAFAVPFAIAALGWGGALMNQERPVEGVVGTGLAIVSAALVGVSQGTDLEAAAWTVNMVLSAALCVVVIARFGDGQMGPNLNSTVIRVAGLLAGAGFVACAVVRITQDTEVPIISLSIGAVFVVAITQNLTALRVERGANWWAMRDESLRHDLVGVLGRQAFLQDADDRLERAAHLGVDSALTVIRIDELAEINVAFGREAGDAALAHVARVLRRHTQPWALLGHLGGGMFAVLSPWDATSIEGAVRLGLLHDPVPAQLPTRIEATFAVVESTPDDLAADLLRAARADLGPAANSTSSEAAGPSGSVIGSESVIRIRGTENLKLDSLDE